MLTVTHHLGWSMEIRGNELSKLNKSTNTIVWTRLTDNEEKLLDAAKTKVLVKYINREAWKPVLYARRTDKH